MTPLADASASDLACIAIVAALAVLAIWLNLGDIEAAAARIRHTIRSLRRRT